MEPLPEKVEKEPGLDGDLMILHRRWAGRGRRGEKNGVPREQAQRRARDSTHWPGTKPWTSVLEPRMETHQQKELRR